ncbi:hypothetical protein Lal_00023047 [Lupinus albus]|nr:hypothetical protein Lal_00023047 [Lupinus albus]
MAELRSSTQPSRRSHSQTSLWSLSPVGPPLPVRSSSRVPPQLPFLMPSQSSLPLTPSSNKRDVSYGRIPSPTAEHGWGSVAPLPTGFRTYAAGPSSVGTKPYAPGPSSLATKPYGFGPDFGARPPPPPPKVNMRMNELAENKRKMEMMHAQKSDFPSTSRGTGVFHPLPWVQLQPSKNNNRGLKQDEVRVSKPIDIPKGNNGDMVEDQLSLADEYGLPKEWTY